MEKLSGDLQQRLLKIFRVEADEHLRELVKGLHTLESGNADDATLESVFREMHSLKGAARAVALQDFERLTHAAESLLSALRKKILAPDRAVLDALNAVVDALQRQVPRLADAGPVALLPVAALLRQIDSVLHSTAHAATPARTQAGTGEAQGSAAAADQPILSGPLPPASAATPYVRVAAATLDALWAGAEAFVSARLVAEQRVQEIQQLCQTVDLWRRQRQRGPQAQRLLPAAAGRSYREGARAQTGAPSGHWDRLAAEDELRVKDFESRLGALYRSAQADQRNLSNMIDSLHEGMKDSLMQPVALLMDGVPSLVRELAHAEGKEVRLLSQGGDVQIDRRVVDGLRTPLMHLLRNAVHHGIESAATRRAAGKTEHGTLRVLASAGEAGTLELLVEDDGAGIAQAEVLAAAQRARHSTPTSEHSATVALSMIFESGISTSNAVGNISGRGLGLAIVREKIEQLGGSIRVRSEPGAGCSFCIRVPLTLANFRGVLVRVAGRIFILPTAQVRRCLRVDAGKVSQSEGRASIEWMQRIVSLHSLAQLLDLPTPLRSSGKVPTSVLVVLVEAAELPMLAFEVDEVVGEQEVLLKLLAWPLQRLRHVMGATLLGDGQWVPVLHPADLVRAAASATRAPLAHAEQQPGSAPAPSVLVVEDSYTARAMLQAVLEAAGYQVLTAVDGLDALQKLGSAEIDVLVSDVEMPRMNGFDLTQQVRRTPGLEHLPIVLVTALESAEHRSRGQEVGANAYLVKSSFDDRNLLDAVAALL